MKLIIIGASGHGKVVADIADKCGYQEILFLDDDRNIKDCIGYPVVGVIADVEQYREYEVIVAIGNPYIRENMQSMLEKKRFKVATLIHPNAVVAKDVSIGAGTVVMAGTVINPSCKIGKGCIINTSASVDHDNVLGDYVHVSVGSHLAGNVSVGAYTWVGAGAVISNNISVRGNCMIGAGAVVVRDIDQTGTYVGMPAKRKNDKSETSGE